MNILLVDIENCPSVLWSINKFLAKYDQIIICYSSCRTKISFETIHTFLNAYMIGKLQIVYVNKNKQKNKNAADHAISFVAGKISNDPSTTKVSICSGDSDLDSTVNMLRSNGFASERIAPDFKIAQKNSFKAKRSNMQHA